MQQKKLLAGLALATGLLMAFRPRPTDEGLLPRIVRQLEGFYSAARQEKAYLHLDRPVYATGETIWFSAYVVDATRHQLDSLSRVLHVELLSPQRQVVARRTLRLDGGRASGDLDIADSLTAGTYVLRAYTSWMRNAGAAEEYMYSRRLAVWAASPLSPPDAPTGAATSTSSAKGAAGPRPDVQFFPEGGSLVEGLPAVVAGKATDAFGRGVAVRGQILNAQNVVVAAFATRHAGMGRAAFVPGTGQRYRAHLTLPDGSAADYPLPAVQPGGYVLHVVETADNFLVEARYRGVAGAPAPGPVQLLTEVRGVAAYPGPRPVLADAPAMWRMPKKNYSAGIVHFTLFDALGVPQCERLAFVATNAGQPGLRVSVAADQPAYGPHVPVQLNVRVTDAAGQPVAAALSVAVSDASLATLDPNAETIASSLLLTSDLVGHVESPGYYFREPSAVTAQALDDLLLTQGWRRFVWKDVLAGGAPAELHPHEVDIELAGQVVSEHGNRPIPNSQLTFLQLKPVKNMATGTTTADGHFRFTGFAGNDTAVVTLQARRAQGASNVVIRPDAGPPPGRGLLPALPPTSATVGAFVRRSRQAQAADLDLHPDKAIRSIRLGNVAVTAKRDRVPANDPRRLYGASGGTVINFADLVSAQSGQNMLQVLQGRVAGLSVTGNPPNVSVQIRSAGTPLFILDGQRVDIDVVSSLPASSIESVEVFKGPEAAIFGGSGGVIAIYTKRGDPSYKGSELPAPGLLTVRVPGYYRAREFFQPRYNALLTNPPADLRTSTLYWNPTVRTNARGEAELHFFTGDVGGTFQAVAEGVSREGQPALGTGSLTVRGK